MKCPNCGDECRPDSNFCMSCGTPLNNNKEDKKIISNIKKSIDKTTGNVDSYVKSDDNSSNGLFNLALGNASVDDADLKYIEDFIFDDEVVIKSFQFIRDSIILTNYGIYEIDVQGLTGKKVEVKFYPKKSIKTISFETAGTLDMDVDIKI